MKTQTLSGILCILMAALLSTACGETKQAPEPVAIEEIPESLDAAFKGAEGEVREAVNETLAAIQGADDGSALFRLQMLCDRPDLTREQRAVASASMMAVNLRLQAAAAAGDRTAAQALEIQRARK